MASKIVALVTGLVLVSALFVFSSQSPSRPRTLSAYVTSLVDRTPNQQFNARRAARLIDGYVIFPQQVFSFNKTVGGWSSDQGYRRAPVSYNGILVDEYGGGVCQTSSTVYNSALLAGLDVIERHPHTFAPGYVPEGRDAAVAYENVDLRIKNPYTVQVILHAKVEDHLLVCGFTSLQQPATDAIVYTKILDTFPAPVAPPQPGAGFKRSRWRLQGRSGVRVATYRRTFDSKGNLVTSQLISDNIYRGITAASWSSR
jgi:vancomycin resistance protein VanW